MKTISRLEHRPMLCWKIQINILTLSHTVYRWKRFSNITWKLKNIYFRYFTRNFFHKLKTIHDKLLMNQTFFLQMPDDWSFRQVFDFYFKAHKVFDLKFDPDLENAMVFLQTYLFKLEDGQKPPTQPMKELIHDLRNELNRSFD